MRDNASSHISGRAREFCEGNKINILKDWPPFSPDLNQIEDIWELIKSKSMKKDIEKISELILEIQEAY